MTIGIASYGVSSGAAIVTAIRGAELLGRGAIGGFAVFAILDHEGTFRYRSTQNGGVTALDIPSSWLKASLAAGISSGPDRPEPLIQFLAGRNGCGLVTGHRLPNSSTVTGQPVNQAVLEQMASGADPQCAINAVLNGCPEVDAGLIALSEDGKLGWANSMRVQRRGDVGEAYRCEPDRGFALFHNSIFAQSADCQALADSLAGMVWETLTGAPAQHFTIRLASPVSLSLTGRDRVLIDSDGTIVGLETADANLVAADRIATAAYLSTEIWQGEHMVAYVASELFAKIARGVAYPQDRPAANTLIARRCNVAA